MARICLTPLLISCKDSLCWVVFLLFPFSLFAQIGVIPSSPKPATFVPILLNNPAPNYPGPRGGILGDPIQERNRRLLQADGVLPEQFTSPRNKQAELDNDLKETALITANEAWLEKSKSYRNAFSALSNLNPDSFSLTKAVYLVENAYLEGRLSYAALDKALSDRAELVKQTLHRDGIDRKGNVALNYGIQQLFQQSTSFKAGPGQPSITVAPFKYDFSDIRGDTDYAKMFVSKAIATGKGQCHSLPLLYLLIAEKLGAKAYLSLAPQHSFVQFVDDAGRVNNFECTNGHLVTDTWMIESGYITTEAMQSKLYLDSLSHRKLYAQMLADLLLGYLHKFPYDAFADQVEKRILSINPANLTALIVDANLKTELAMTAIRAAGSPKPEDLPRFPAAFRAYHGMQTAYKKVQDLGYQDMPDEAYKRWLQSFQLAKERQASEELKERQRREIQQLKSRSIIIKSPKG